MKLYFILIKKRAYMKWFWSLFILVILSSCQSDYTKNEKILCAENLLDTNKPDSAYQLLKSIQHPENLSKADYAAWCLHFTQAQNKLHIELKSDSLIQHSIKYYSRSQHSKYLGISWYLYGCICRNQAKNKLAIGAFKKAESILSTTNEHKYRGLIAFNIGYICMQDELYNHSLSYYKKSLKFFKLAKEKKYEAYAYREISSMYNDLYYSYDSIMTYSNLALRLAYESNDTVNYYNILMRQGMLLCNRNSMLSKSYIRQGLNYFPLQKSFYAAYLAYDYSKLNQNDSAKYFLNIYLKDTFNNSPYKVTGLHAAALIALNERKYDKAYYYLEKSYLLRDSTFRAAIKSQLYRIDKQYDVSVKEKENAELQLTIRNYLIAIAILIIVVLAISFVATSVLNRVKLNNAQTELERERLEHENEIYRTTNAQKQEIILLKLNQNIANTLQFNELKKTFKSTGKKEEFYEQLAKQSMLTEDVWKQYIDDVNYLYDNRISQLKEKFDLTKTDLIVIVLMCLKVSLIDSCILLNMERQTMYQRRKTIKKRLVLSVETDLEQWINETVNENKVININA